MMPPTKAMLVRWLVLAGTATAASCAAPTMADPLKELSDIENGPSIHLRAMSVLDQTPEDQGYRQMLRRMIWQPGYTIESREAAFLRLERLDPNGLKQTIQIRLPLLGALEWRRRLCQLIAQRGWTELSPTLARAWATKIGGWVDTETDRPEYLALAAMHGKDHVVDEVFRIFLESKGPQQAMLRARCWELLVRLGQRDRLMRLVTTGQVPPDDALLNDLQAGVRELGILPLNYEELLWMRSLRTPERAEFWSQAASALALLPPEQRQVLELRDLPVIVAAWRHEPELLDQSREQLYRRVQEFMQTARRHAYTVNFDGWAGEYPQRLAEWRGKLTWGDLAAMLMAVRALRVPQVVDHLFDYAERDRIDISTEYGGIVRLDDQGRFEIVEFVPRHREHDNKFFSSQAMLDAAYTALFHFHLHAQKHDNQAYAGPHMGDLYYADNTRANCLVFTFIKPDVINVDYYRHDRVIVDLGEIRRSTGG